MICPACGTNNENGFKFCVKCGSNLENPSEINYESVDMGGYHTEEEFASEGNAGFTMGSGTFTISDRPAADSASDFYTSDELNDTDEEFDFSMYDEPDHVAGFGSPNSSPLPPPKTLSAANEPVHSQDIRQQQHAPHPNMPQGMGMGAFQQQNNFQQGNYQQPSGSFSQQGNMPQSMGSFPQSAQNGYPQSAVNMGFSQSNQQGFPQNNSGSGNNQYMQQPMMFAQPQIIGYDQNGTPIYGQPQMMFAQPQMMFAQPQIIGYDQNGTPIYGQPQMMFTQPQIIGYDQSGMPIYGQPQVSAQPDQTATQGSSVVPPVGGVQSVSSKPAPEPVKEEKTDFWDFFDDGKKDVHHEEVSQDDFFGKSSHSSGMGDLSVEGLDLSQLHRSEKKKKSYMNDTPLVDAQDLAPNEAGHISNLYMGSTAKVNADDLEAHSSEHSQDKMRVTSDVDVSKLSENIHIKSRISMGNAGFADADTIQAYTHEHKASIMGEADHAVEALPKKKNPYESELDKIELPEYMKAKKTVREETIEIPSLPKV